MISKITKTEITIKKINININHSLMTKSENNQLIALRNLISHCLLI